MYKIKHINAFFPLYFLDGKCFLILKFADSGSDYPYGQWSVVIENNSDGLMMTPLSPHFPHDKMTGNIEFDLFRAPERIWSAKLENEK